MLQRVLPNTVTTWANAVSVSSRMSSGSVANHTASIIAATGCAIGQFIVTVVAPRAKTANLGATVAAQRISKIDIHGVIEAGCIAHARRKFVELHFSNQSTIAEAAIELIGQLNCIEREVVSPEVILTHRSRIPDAASLEAALVFAQAVTQLLDDVAHCAALIGALRACRRSGFLPL